MTFENKKPFSFFNVFFKKMRNFLKDANYQAINFYNFFRFQGEIGGFVVIFIILRRKTGEKCNINFGFFSTKEEFLFVTGDKK